MAAARALDRISLTPGAMQGADLALDAISLASICFLAAVGLAITFGVMRVINMAHGEFIMMGAHTGHVVQLVIANQTASILLALPLAFAVTFAAGVAIDRLVIRHLYKRPLETLSATFGISIALRQIARNILGTQARPLTAPGWLDGALTFNDVVQISHIRIAIFVLAIVFLCVILFIMKRTRPALEVRAVQQNPAMAARRGIYARTRSFLARNPSVLTFLAAMARFTVTVTLLAEGFGIGVVSTSFVKVLGKTLCLCLVAIAMDLIRGCAAVLSPRHMAFFALGG